MWEQLTQDILSNDITELYTPDIIRESINSLKSGKQDAVHDLMTQNLYMHKYVSMIVYVHSIMPV